MLRRLLRALLVCWALASELPAVEVTIPPVPAINGRGEFVQDFASLLMPAPVEMRARVFRAQQTAMEDNNTPIILVTIHRMAAFGYSGEDIQPFAQQWFDEWEIGTEKQTGENRGILLLISRADRKARIELGKDWGRRWDGHCQRIMDGVILPHFRNERYEMGIIEGMEKLAAMARLGPDGTIPRSHWYEAPLDFVNTYFGESRVGIFSWSLFPMPVIFIFFAVGLINIIYGVVQGKRVAIYCGLAICGLAVITFVTIGLAVIYAVRCSTAGPLPLALPGREAVAGAAVVEGVAVLVVVDSEVDPAVEEEQVAAGKWKLPGSLGLTVLLALLACPLGHAAEIPPVPAMDGSG
ncbi:MAG: TPM domain-containing protein, partial [Pirellulaceae bacterium]|nr:TPM domain-containing protein [Pirellulaceae bacterium]